MEPVGGRLSVIVSTRSVEPELQNRLADARIVPEVAISRNMHLRVLVDAPDSDVIADLPEGDFRLFQAIGRQGFAISGGLRDGSFHSDLCLRVALECDRDLEPTFHAFLTDNIFGRFGPLCRRRLRQERVLFVARSRLGSSEYRDIRHELPTFILRSGEDVSLRARCEIYNEDGSLQCFGALPAQGQISSARVVFDDPNGTGCCIVRRDGMLRRLGRADDHSE